MIKVSWHFRCQEILFMSSFLKVYKQENLKPCINCPSLLIQIFHLINIMINNSIVDVMNKC